MNKRLTVFAMVALLVATWTSAPGQTRKSRFDPSGAFWISGDPPADFSDFSAINLNMRQLRRLPTSGLQLNDGTSFRFRNIVVKQNNFTFTTVTLKSVYYTFSGRFLKGGDFASTWMTGTGEFTAYWSGVPSMA